MLWSRHSSSTCGECPECLRRIQEPGQAVDPGTGWHGLARFEAYRCASAQEVRSRHDHPWANLFRLRRLGRVQSDLTGATLRCQNQPQ